MKTHDKTILVTGATGRQGGAVARHLLNDGWLVRALTRDPGKPSARELSALGIEVVQGDLNDIRSDHRAFTGLYGIYSVQDFWETGVEAEIRQGQRLVEIGREVGIKHFVYSSVGAAERHTGIPHFDSKWRIEEYIRELKLPHTIVRPVFFMDNFNTPDYRHDILDGTLRLPMDPAKPLQMIAVDNIGGFVARVFINPGEYLGKAIELAGDELTMPQVAELLGKEIGRKVEYVQVPLEPIRKTSPALGTMFDWFNAYGYTANISDLRRRYPELLTFKSWLRATGWAKALQEVGVASGI